MLKWYNVRSRTWLAQDIRSNITLCLLEFRLTSPLGTPSGKWLYLTIYSSSCPNTDTIWHQWYQVVPGKDKTHSCGLILNNNDILVTNKSWNTLLTVQAECSRQNKKSHINYKIVTQIYHFWLNYVAVFLDNLCHSLIVECGGTYKPKNLSNSWTRKVDI